MEEENLCTSLPDVVETELPHNSQTSADQSTNGEQEDLVFDEAEMSKTQEQDAASHRSPEEAERFEETMWTLQPVTCTLSSLSFASVGWDMPDSSAETASFVTDSSLANELYSEGVTSLSSTSFSHHHQPQDVTVEPYKQEDKEEQDEVDTRHLNAAIESTGNDYKPCDAADEKEPTKQEKEDSAAEQSESSTEISQHIDSEEDEEHSVTSNEDLLENSDKIQCSSEAADTFLDLKVEKEQEFSVLLSEQEDSEGEQASTNGVETDGAKEDWNEVQEEKSLSNISDEEEPALADSFETKQEHEEEGEGQEQQSFTDISNKEEPAVADCVETQEEHQDVSEVEEQQSLTNISNEEESEESETVSCLSYLEVPAEVLQTDNTGLSTPTDALKDLQEFELPEGGELSGDKKDIETPVDLDDDLSVLPEEMCEEVEEKVDPELSDSEDNNEEVSDQQAEKAENAENSSERPEEAANLEKTNSLEQQECDQDRVASLQPENSESESGETCEEAKQMPPEESDQSVQLQDQSPEMASPNQLTPLETPEDQPEQTACDPQESTVTGNPSELNELPQQTAHSSPQPGPSDKMNESEMTEQLSPDSEATPQNEEAELNHVERQVETLDQTEDAGITDSGNPVEVVSNGDKHEDSVVPYMNGGKVDREKACRLAEQLFKLDNIQRSDVVKHLDKDNDFSHAVGEEYLKFFDFSSQTLDQALRSFLKVVILIGETQERERVLQHFSNRFHECNPDSYPSSGAALALTCALMLLNTDLHGQNVGKSMSSSKFVTNLDGMNEGGNFNKELLKSLYNSIKSEPLEWAVDEEELKNLVDENAGDDAPWRSKSNPFLDVPQDKKATMVKQGFLQRKLHADINGKRTPWGKRSWKPFFGELKGMTLYLQKHDYRKDQPVNEDMVGVHHSLAEPAADYTKKPHVFRLQTADWRVFLFQASSKTEMNSWICRINLVSALHSSPPFPAAVGSQRRFFRPILPASKSAHSLERQLQCHSGKLDSFKADLLHQQENAPDSKKAKTRDLEEHRVRTEYLQYEVCRYETYIQVLEAWKSVPKMDDGTLASADLKLFDKAACGDCMGDEDEDEAGLKRSYSSPSLDLELASPTIIKVKRNISERRTYRRTIVPRFKEA